MQQQHVDYKIAEALLKKGSYNAQQTWSLNRRAWVDMVINLAHDHGGFGITSNVISRKAALYTATARFIAFVGTLSLANQSTWLPDTLTNLSTWTSTPLLALRSIHEWLLATYDCTEDQPSAQHSGSAPAQQPNQTGSSQLSEDVKLSLPQLSRLHEAYLQRGQSQAAPSQSTPPQQNTNPTLIPTQRSVTHQIIKNWGALMPKSRTSSTAPATRNSSRFTARRKSPPQTTTQPCARKCAHWNLRRKTNSLARYAGSPWVFLAKSGLGTTPTVGTFPFGRPSSAPPLVNVSQSSLPSSPNPTPEQHAGATSSSLTCTATTSAHVKVTQVPPSRTTGWLPSSVLSSGPPDTRLRHRGLPLARARSAEISRSPTTCRTLPAVAIWSSMLASPTTDTEVAQLTLTLTALSHTLTHLMPRSTKLLDERLTNTATHTLTITASLSCPPSQAPPHACTANSFAFSFSRLIGRLRNTSASWVRQRNLTSFRCAAFYSSLQASSPQKPPLCVSIHYGSRRLPDSLACCV